MRRLSFYARVAQTTGVDRDDLVPVLLTGLGAVLAGVLLGEVIALVVVTGSIVNPMFLVGAFTSGPFVLATLYGGRWLSTSDVPAHLYWRVALWCLGGLVGFTLINVATMVLLGPLGVFELVGWLRWAAALGAGTGVTIGIVEARAVHRAVLAERSRIRAEEAETREELLAYLHNLLRHKVRNAVNAIDGNASLLATGDGDRERVDAIHRQTDDLLWITRETRTLLEASGMDEDVGTLELCAILREELEGVEERFGDVEVEFRCPEPVSVDGDRLLRRAFRNLVTNAAVHNPEEVSRVAVTVEGTADTVTVRIEDDGTGIPEHKRRELFDLDRGGTPEKGLGLPLVRILVERNGGTIELAESGVDGSVFTVELPRAGERVAGTDEERTASSLAP